MKKFTLKLILVLLPILAILFVYIVNDPFKVLYHYDSYFAKDGVQYITLNKDYVSTETFKNNYNKYKYDSYIFGNSRSMYYHVNEWEKHINSDKCFHFDASGESLYGIERKIQFLDKKNVNIKNALIVFDAYSCMVVNNTEGHVMKKHPEISGESKIDYQIDFLKDFFDVQFLKVYLKFLTTHKLSREMLDAHVLNTVETHYDVASNELSFPEYESLIEKNRDSFYLPRMNVFYKRDTFLHYCTPVLGVAQKDLLNNIKKVFDKDQTSYRIVISPLYDQKKIDSTDLKELYAIFGKENVFDFSGINEFTGSIYNYYEDSHYRPFIANKIMDIIYK